MTTSPAAVRAQLRAWAKPEALRARLSAVLGLADAGCVVAFAWAVSRTVSALAGHALSTAMVAPWLAAMMASLSLRAAIGVAVSKFDGTTSRRIIMAVRRQIMADALDGRITDTVQLGSLFEDTEALDAYYTRFTRTSWAAAVVPLLLTAAIAWQSPVSAAIVALALVPFVALMAIVGMTSAAAAARQLDALARLSNLFADRVRALPLILAYDDVARQTKAIGQAAQQVASRTLGVLKIAFLSSAVLEFFAAISVALVAVYCGFYLLGNLPIPVPEHLTLAKALFVLALAPEVYAPMRRLSAGYHDRQTAAAATARLMALHPGALPEAQSIRLPIAPVIRYDDVVCTFAGDPQLTIGPVSFAARPDTVTALTGPTGSGKTSLLRLLLGIGQIARGSLSINNQPLGDLTASIAWVSQHPPILAGSLRDNLLFSNHEASDEALHRAIAMSGLEPVIRRRGLDGRIDERGSGLSGGERKRLGLARALLRDAPVLVLDEPTADLDEKAEADLIEILPGIFAGRTVILSTHSPRLAALATQEVRLA